MKMFDTAAFAWHLIIGLWGSLAVIRVLLGSVACGSCVVGRKIYYGDLQIKHIFQRRTARFSR